MAKYVYNFEEMNSINKKLDSVSTDMLTSVKDYNSNIKTALSGWTGKASSDFNTSFNNQSENFIKYINNIQSLAKFIEITSKTITKAEEELAKLKI